MTVNESAGTKKDVVVRREFEASVEQVWRAWTDPEQVVRWWGPDHFTSPSAKIDFREGGVSIVCMRAPADWGGQDFYNTWEYRKIYLLADGRLLNLSAAEGHPAAVMDMSFANQALSAEWVAKNHGKLENKVYVVPREIDEAIASLKLKAMGIKIDTLSAEQEKYMTSWQSGT